MDPDKFHRCQSLSALAATLKQFDYDSDSIERLYFKPLGIEMPYDPHIRRDIKMIERLVQVMSKYEDENPDKIPPRRINEIAVSAALSPDSVRLLIETFRKFRRTIDSSDC